MAAIPFQSEIEALLYISDDRRIASYLRSQCDRKVVTHDHVAAVRAKSKNPHHHIRALKPGFKTMECPYGHPDAIGSVTAMADNPR